MIEMVTVIAIIAVLAAILTPLVSNYIDQSRVAKAQSDTRTIGESISRFEKDVGRYPMFTVGTGALADSSADVGRLETPGTNPTATDTLWTQTPTFANTLCASNTCSVEPLANQLLTNSRLYPTTSSMAKPFKWKGPYLDATADPWGNKYLANIINCKSASTNACFVISAGPDGIVQTAFNISETSAVSASGDDVLYRIR